MATGRNKYILDLQENVRELQRNHNELTNIVLKAVMDVKKLMETTGTAPATMAAPPVAKGGALRMPQQQAIPRDLPQTIPRDLPQAIPRDLPQTMTQQAIPREVPREVPSGGGLTQLEQQYQQQIEQSRKIQMQQAEQMRELQRQLFEQQTASASASAARPIMASVAKAPKKGRKPRRKVVVESEEEVAADDAATEPDE